jgi:L-amino acid N-acyltransferase YncA
MAEEIWTPGHCGGTARRFTVAAMNLPHVRPAQVPDADAIAAIYNAGIAGREATFETDRRSGQDFVERIESGNRRLLVAEIDRRVVGCAWLSPYSERDCYAGVNECSVYVAAAARGRGVGTELCERVAEEAQRSGLYKLIGKLFTSNVASLRLVRRCGFREVGLHRCHGRLDGEWRDVLLVERLIGDAANACRDAA